MSCEAVLKELKCEYLTEPLAVLETKPRLSWIIEDGRRGAFQQSVRVKAFSDEQKRIADIPDLWDSGELQISDNFVFYAGKPLKPGQDCYWSAESFVRADDGAVLRYCGESYFKKSLGRGDFSAKWIENAEKQDSYMPAHAGYLSLNGVDAFERKTLTVDLGGIKHVDDIILYGARPFFMPERVPDAPGYLYPVKFTLSVAKNEDFSDEIIIFDATEPVPNPGVQPVYYSVNGEIRFIRIALKQMQEREKGVYAFSFSQLEAMSGNENVALGCKVTATDSQEDEFFGVSKLTDGSVSWHTAGRAKSLKQPLFRREFYAKAKVKKAYLYASALGVMEISLNGNRVSDSYLSPEWTEYTQYSQYRCYDVSDKIAEGGNALGIALGDGWYAGRVGMANVFGPGVLRGIYGGETPKFFMQLEIEYENGGREKIVSDDKFQSTIRSPYISTDIYDGEVYDARLYAEGWDKFGFKTGRDWQNARAAEEIDVDLVPQISEPIGEIERLKAVKITKNSAGEYIVDFGKVHTGLISARLRGEEGRRVTFRYAEALNSRGDCYFANMRGAIPRDVYICSGKGEEIYSPKFTYRGYRYVQIRGLSYEPKIEDFESIFISSAMERVGFYNFDEPYFNRLSEAVCNTVRCNLMGVQTDVCERDERLGWNMDGFENSRYYLDSGRFFMHNSRERERIDCPEGMRPEQTPCALKMYAGILQLDAKNPRIMYEHYGDKRLIEECYGIAKNAVLKMEKTYPELIVETVGYVDWLNGDTVLIDGYPESGAQIGTPCYQTVMFYEQADCVSYFAKILGNREDEEYFADLRDRIGENFRKRFYDESTGILERDTQTGYAISLFHGILSGKAGEKGAMNLEKALERYGNRFSTGAYTIGKMLSALSENGRHKLAQEVALNPKAPSFRYMLDCGATSIWERWDSYIAEKPRLQVKKRWQAEREELTYISEDGFGDIGMNSLCHLEFTCVSVWLAEELAGFKIEDEYAGRRFFVNVNPEGSVKRAETSYKLPCGRVNFEWKSSGAETELRITVPVGAKAAVTMPGSAVYEGETELAFAEKADGKVRFELSSGSYKLVAR